MSSNSFASTVDLALRPSARAHRWLFALHAVPLVVLPLAMESGPAMAGVAVLVGLSWVFVRRHAAFGYGRKAIVRMVWHAEGTWTLTRADRGTCEARLRGDSSTWSAVTVLRFDLVPQGQATRILFGDEAPPDPLRRLRARLTAQRDHVRTPAPPP